MNIRRAEHSRAVHVSYSKPEGALAETFDVQEIPNMDKLTRL